MADAIWTEFNNQFITWPETVEKVDFLMHRMCGARALQGAFAAMDGCHIAIRAPVQNAKQYYNKQFYSVVLLGVGLRAARRRADVCGLFITYLRKNYNTE
jgi:hypothetical protein